VLYSVILLSSLASAEFREKNQTFLKAVFNFISYSANNTFYRLTQTSIKDRCMNFVIQGQTAHCSSTIEVLEFNQKFHENMLHKAPVKKEHQCHT